MVNRKNAFVIIVVMGIVFLSYAKRNNTAEEVIYDQTLYDFQPGTFPMPDFKDNPLTIEGVKLGRMLFYEKSMSKKGIQACAGCHLQSHGFSDSTRFSIGVEGKQGIRQAMGIFNMAWHTNEFFWDGRAHLLRDQSLEPIQDELEMNETLENVIAKLSAKEMYRKQFFRAFGSEEITSEKMSLAMEQFMNTIVSNHSKYDKFLSGEAILSPAEERGRKLFFMEYDEFLPGKSGAGCAHCHKGFNFSNNKYMNNGLGAEGIAPDFGREYATSNESDRGKFKVPSLRNIAVTAPYMHDGRFKTLDEVIEHYNSGIKTSTSLDSVLAATQNTGLRLSAQDKSDIIAFLHTLTDRTLATDQRFSNPF